MDSIAELYAKISAQFWKAEQIARWAEDRFFRRAVHQQTSSGSASGNLPIITLSDGTIDASFISSTAVAEYIADTAGAMVTGNTETGITVTYQDADNTLDFALDDEYIADLIGTMVTGNTETDIAVTYQDTDNTIDFVVSATLVGDRIHAATGKTPPVDADELGLADSAASFVLKKLTWANLKATVAAYYDTLATTMTNKILTTPTIASFVNATHNHTNAAGGGTLDHGTALTGLSDNDHPQYLQGSGGYNNGGMFITNYSEDVADITSTQALTVQVTSGAARRLHITHFDIALARGATNNVYAYFTGWVAWTWELGGATTIRASDVSHGTSGTDACTLTTITNGIQVVVDSSAFGNTLDSNALFVHDVSETPISVATSIA